MYKRHGKFEKLTPVIDGLVYKKQLTVLAGGPGAGKSRMLLAMADGLARGAEGWWGAYSPLSILYCSERDWAFNCVQMKTVGVDSLAPGLDFFCVPDIGHFEDFARNPTQYITTHFLEAHALKPDLVILDTLCFFYSHRAIDGNVNLNDYDVNRRQCNELKMWANKFEFGLLAAHHSSKMKSDSKYENPRDRILGSQAIASATIATAVIERADPVESTGYVIAHFDSHMGMLQTPRFFQTDLYREVTRDTFSSALNLQDSMKPMGPAEQRVLSEIPYDNPVLFTAIIEATETKYEMKRNRTYAILDSLAKKGFITVTADVTCGKRQAKRNAVL